MKVLAVVGPSDSGKTTLVTRLAERLSERGSVATVKHLTHEPDVDTEGKDTARHRAGGSVHTVGVTDEGTWFATGESRSLDEILVEFDRHYEYAIVEGFSGSDLPKVVLGGRAAAGPIVATAPAADAVDIDSVLASLRNAEPYR